MQRGILGALAVSALFVGIWAEFGPASFYRSFPGFGRHWVSVLGPYDEHLVRDVGGLYLALAVVTLGAQWLADRRVTLIVALAWLAFSLPHLVFHLWHLDHRSGVDQVASLAGLILTVLGAAALGFGTRSNIGVAPGVDDVADRGIPCG